MKTEELFLVFLQLHNQVQILMATSSRRSVDTARHYRPANGAIPLKLFLTGIRLNYFPKGPLNSVSPIDGVLFA